MSENELKYFRNEPFMSPNNYDISFRTSDIPSNVPRENGHNLEKRLQKLVSASKFIHLSFDAKPLESNNTISVYSKLKIDNEEKD